MDPAEQPTDERIQRAGTARGVARSAGQPGPNHSHLDVHAAPRRAAHRQRQSRELFYAERFPPDVKKAYDAWLAEKPFENPTADPHPFVPNLYEVRGAVEAAAVRADSVRRVAEAREAGNRSGQYLANTVLFATVLFFAGTAGKFEQPRVRLFAATFGVALFVFAVIRTLLMPAA